MVQLQALVILVVMTTALSLPQRYYDDAISRSYDFDPSSGVHRSSFQTRDGALVQENGFLIRTNDGTDVVVGKMGSYSYTSPDGKPVSVSFIADANGYRATGDVIPVAPPTNPPTFRLF